MVIGRRSDENPILVPNKKNFWEAEATFNGCPVKDGRGTHLFYRALSTQRFQAGAELMVSSIGYAKSRDGVHFTDRRPFVVPEYEWERYGCEDPRVTKLGNKYYIFYTALSQYPFGPAGIRIGLAMSRDLKRVEAKHPVTHFNSKAMTLFPEKIGGKFAALLAVDTDRPPVRLGIAFFKREEEMWSEAYWDEWRRELDAKHRLTLERGDGDHVEIGAPPVRTTYGWLLVYAHIRNYLTSRRPIFGIEAALLDLKNPRKILGRTSGPMLVPDEEYEMYGKVPNVIFPSGALIVGDTLRVYYGAADTTLCLATFKLKDVIREIRSKPREVPKPVRFKKNPIIVPNAENSWEAGATFNPGALAIGRTVHLLYRAQSKDGLSVFGYASSKDGFRIGERSFEPAYRPRAPFETRKHHTGNAGCEDPRLTQIGSTIHLFYTAYDGEAPPRVAFSSISVRDFLAKRWGAWTQPVLLSPPGLDDKDAALFPQKFRGKFAVIHRLRNSMDLTFVDTLAFKGYRWLEENDWLKPRPGSWDDEKVGLAAPPLKTAKGWLLLYHGISRADRVYRVGAVLLDLKNPREIVARLDRPILEPETDYERHGNIPNVVFPCGAVILRGQLFVYYGAADTTTAVATYDLAKLLRALTG